VTTINVKRRSKRVGDRVRGCRVPAAAFIKQRANLFLS
jgi:hypothetical protein